MVTSEKGYPIDSFPKGEIHTSKNNLTNPLNHHIPSSNHQKTPQNPTNPTKNSTSTLKNHLLQSKKTTSWRVLILKPPSNSPKNPTKPYKNHKEPYQTLQNPTKPLMKTRISKSPNLPSTSVRLGGLSGIAACGAKYGLGEVGVALRRRPTFFFFF